MRAACACRARQPVQKTGRTSTVTARGTLAVFLRSRYAKNPYRLPLVSVNRSVTGGFNAISNTSTIDHLNTDEHGIDARQGDATSSIEEHMQGYSCVGRLLPEGASLEAIARNLPMEVYAYSALTATLRLLLPLALAIAGEWLLWTQALGPLANVLLWAMVGTAYTGLFAVAINCCQGSLFPDNLVISDVLGATLMAPALVSYQSWRVAHFSELLQVNMLQRDYFNGRPFTVEELQQMPAWRLRLVKLFCTTPFKLLGSIVKWVQFLKEYDLRPYSRFETKLTFLISWGVPLAFIAVVWPAILIHGGMLGWVNLWLMPWLAFHAWMSTLSLLQHTAPHIPLRPATYEYDKAQAVISGTATVVLPRWLEYIINDLNYHIPHHISLDIPFYNFKTAYLYLRKRLSPYITECSLNLSLFRSHLQRWQVYDQESQSYVSYAAVADRLRDAQSN